MLRFTAVALVFLLSVPAFAEERSPVEDEYVACLIGKAVVEMHYGAGSDDALDVAYKGCEALAAGIEGDEAEGIGDFVAMTVEKLDIHQGAAEHL